MRWLLLLLVAIAACEPSGLKDTGVADGAPGLDRCPLSVVPQTECDLPRLVYCDYRAGWSCECVAERWVCGPDAG